MKRILVAYTTNSGSTAEVAQAIAEPLACDAQVDVRPLSDVRSVEGYDAVIIGAPMIFGWHRAAVQFVKRHQQALSSRPVAYFCTLLSLTQPVGGQPDAELPTQLFVDPQLAQLPHNPARLSLKERYASLNNYLRPVLRAAPAVRPVSVAFFGGKLELFRLNWWQMLFVMAVIQAQPGDRRNWEGIRQWAEGLRFHHQEYHAANIDAKAAPHPPGPRA